MLRSNPCSTVASYPPLRENFEESRKPRTSSTSKTSLISVPTSITQTRPSPPTSLTTFGSKCIWTSRREQLPIEIRINLLSQVLTQMDEPSVRARASLYEAVFQRHEQLCKLQREITIKIEAVCARFLPEGLYPLGRTPFINGYSASFYFEIFEAVDNWLKSDLCKKPSHQEMGRALQMCLKNTISLLNLSLEDQKDLDVLATKSLSPSMSKPLKFAKQLLLFIELSKVNQELWLPLLCLNPANKRQCHIILLRLHKIREASTDSPTLWKATLINIGLGALGISTTGTLLCRDFEVFVSQEFLTLDALDLLKGTFESPEKLYETLQKELFAGFSLGETRPLSLSGLCATQTWHFALKDFLKKPAYIQLMRFWVDREAKIIHRHRLLAGHLGHETSFVKIGSPDLEKPETVSYEWLKGRVPFWLPKPSPTFNPLECELPTVCEPLYRLVMAQLSRFIRQ